MNVLLVHPKWPETFWSFNHALKFIGKRSASPPLGLITVAALLPAHWNKRLVDLNVTSRFKDSDLDWADMVFVGGMAIQRDSARAIFARCRAAGKRIVAGGPLFTAEHENFPEVDHFVLNEAELTLPPFLADLESGKAQRVYSTQEFADLRKTPAPMIELLNFRQYASMSVQYSRGCPFNCEFCNVTALFGHKPRLKSSAQMIEELNALYDKGWRGGIFFVDDNFIGNKPVLKKELLPALIDWQGDKSGITFNTEASVNLADDPELMRMMTDAGFDMVFVGLETPDDECLRECSKRQNVGRDLVNDVKRIQAAGLQVQGGFIVGFDSDTPSIFQRQIEFIQKSGIATAMVGLLQAPRGTRLFDRLKRENRILGDMTGDNFDGTTNIVPRMPRQELFQGYAEILRYIYAPKHYYRRLKSFLRSYHLPPVAARRKDRRILVFLRSVVKLGILSKERFYYWRLLLWAQFRRPDILPLTVTLMIYGYHFRKVSDRNNTFRA